MDLNTITEVEHPLSESDLPRDWNPSTAYLAGGTWVFSEPQTEITRLIDLGRLGWDELAVDDSGLVVGATCPILALENFDPPAHWQAAPLIRTCARALLASFKVKRVATVGGNICRALPAAGMVTLAVALEGKVLLLGRDGTERTISVLDLIVGEGVASLQPGEVLRKLHLPEAALRKRFGVRRAETVPEGRSMVFLVGTLDDEASFTLTVTASTTRPHRFNFGRIPTAPELAAALEEGIPDSDYVRDTYRTAFYRRHMTALFAGEILEELRNDPSAS